MRPRLACLLTRLYPRAWRRRYGAEFAALLEAGRPGVAAAADVVWSAMREHMIPTQGGNMNQPHRSLGAMMKRPSAFLPLAMSLTALALVLVHVGVYGAVREADEGPTAHLWQMLMAGQLPVVAFFVVRWLPRAPRQTLVVLAEQVGAGLASVAAVFYFNLG